MENMIDKSALWQALKSKNHLLGEPGIRKIDQEEGIEMDDNDEKQIYKNALRKIVELDGEMHEGFLAAGYCTGGESGKYFTKAIQIARTAIADGAMIYAKKQHH